LKDKGMDKKPFLVLKKMKKKKIERKEIDFFSDENFFFQLFSSFIFDFFFSK